MSTAPDKAEGGGGGSGGGGTEKKDFLFVIVNDESKSKNERIREVLAHARRAYLNSEEHRNLQAKRQKEKTTRQLQWRSGTAEEKQVPGRERKKRAAGSGSEKQTTPPRWDERTRTAASAQAVVVHGREQGRRSAWRDETGSTTMYPELTTYTINGAPAGWSIAALANVCNRTHRRSLTARPINRALAV